MIQKRPEDRPKMTEVCEYFQQFKNVDFTNITSEQLIGSGGEGSVYRSYYEMKFVAVKVLQLATIKDDTISRQEQTILLQLDHPNVVKLYTWEDKGLDRYVVIHYTT
jgi:serine/threonine protein kinase